MLNAENGETNVEKNCQSTYVRSNIGHFGCTANWFQESKLGIRVEPSRVRLMPRSEDRYLWKILPEQKDKLSKLFEKNISDHTIGACKELCEGVEEVFEAVLVGSLENVNTQDTVSMVSKCPVS